MLLWQQHVSRYDHGRPSERHTKYHQIAAEAEGAFAASRELHESWRAAFDHARDLGAAAEGLVSIASPYAHIPNLRTLPADHPAAVKVRRQIADALCSSYEQLLQNGRAVTREEIARDVRRLFEGNFNDWVGQS